MINLDIKKAFRLQIDPRAKLWFFMCFTFAIITVRDVSAILAIFAIIGVVLLFEKIPWKEIRSWWVWVALLAGINILPQLWAYFSRHDAVSVQCLFMAVIFVTLRFGAQTLGAIWLIYAFDHSRWSLVFHKLGFSDKLAIMANLIPIYIPTYVADMEATKEAQEARGLDYDKKTCNPFRKIVMTVPLLIPTFVSAIRDIGDKENSIELRGLGAVKRRTWLYSLGPLLPTDFVVVVVSFIMSAAVFLHSSASTTCYYHE